VESGDGYLMSCSKNGTHIVGNGYWDGTNWNRYDVASTAAYAVAAQGYFSVQTAPSGANPIAWTTQFSISNNGVAISSLVGIGNTPTVGGIQVYVKPNAGSTYTLLVDALTNDNSSIAFQARMANGTALLLARGDGLVSLGTSSGNIGFFGSLGTTKP